jgi:serine/threonine protein kinase
LIDIEKGGTSPPEETPTGKHIILLGIAEGMRFVHEQCVIHRDLKPANLLLNESFEPRIGGFGLSTFCEKGSSCSQSLNLRTPLYIGQKLSKVIESARDLMFIRLGF